MLGRLALLFVVVPLLELVLLVQLGQWVGLWPTLALVLATGIAGASLARSQGLRTLAAFQGEVGAGRLPSGPLLDGLAVLIGGAFLLTPGLLTDVVGFSLLIPATRGWLRSRVVKRLEKMRADGTLQVGVMTPMGMSFGQGFGPGFAGHDAPVDEEPSGRVHGLDPRNEINTPR